MFWNVAGMRIKAKDFWRKLADWEVMMLTEIWIDKKRWEKIKNRLPGGYEWGMQEARKKNKKGRTIRRMIMEIRRDVIEKETRIETEKEGIMWEG